MKTQRPLTLALSVCALAMFSVGCDDDTNASPDTVTTTDTAKDSAADGTNDTSGNETDGSGSETTDGGPEATTCNEPLLTIDPLGTLQAAEPAGCTLAGDPTGTTFLVDLLDINTPDSPAVTSAINPLFATDMKSGELVIVFRVTAYDAVTGEATVQAGTGTSCGSYGFDGTPSELTINIQGCDFTTTSTAPLELAPSTVSKPIIVSSLDVAGSFAADQSRILTATLTGTLKESDATGLLVDLGDLGEIDMADFLNALSIPLDADTDGDGTGDAWTLGGNLAAKAITNFSL